MQATTPTRTIGVVLAGGRSERMGQSKAALDISGEPLLRRVIARIRSAFNEIVVVGPIELQSLAPDVTVLPDLRPGLGPLSGLEAALTAATHEKATHAFAVACDMPFISPQLVGFMAELAESDSTIDVVILRSTRSLEYLHAVYAVSSLPAIRARLDAGERSLRGLLDVLRMREVGVEEAERYDPSGLSAFNANTAEEWAHALSIASLDAHTQ